MEYKDEKIAELKKEMRRQKYTDIRGEGVFINGQFVSFRPREVKDIAELYIPEEFIDMPKEMQRMKFPSVSRPQRILTSLNGSVNFAFSFLNQQIPDNQIEQLTGQMKEVIRKSNPAAVFYQEESELLESGHRICMFDFKSFSVDEQLYNMICFTPLGNGILHGTFICLDRESEDWKVLAWEAFRTIREAKGEA